MEQAEGLVLSADDWSCTDGWMIKISEESIKNCQSYALATANFWPLRGILFWALSKAQHLRNSSDTRETLLACSSMNLLSPPQVWGQLVQCLSAKSDMATSEGRHWTDPPLFVTFENGRKWDFANLYIKEKNLAQFLAARQKFEFGWYSFFFGNLC